MNWILNILTVLLAFCAMEFTAWFMHKYVMHGFLWFLHRDHHDPETHFPERNDAFFLVFAIPSWLSIMFGLMNGIDVLFYIGVGIAVYGLAYFLVHDVFIHRRLNFFKQGNHPYLKAIRKAHKVHHKKLVKEDGACFGMLWVPRKYHQEAKKAASSHKTS